MLWKRMRWCMVVIQLSGWIRSMMILLSMLTVPGTHDTLTYSGDATIDDWDAHGHYNDDGSLVDGEPVFDIKHLITQTLDVPAQLALGIRAFDFRLYHKDDDIWAAHGPTTLHVRFEDALNGLSTWLQNHPTETAFVGVKLEVMPWDLTYTKAGFASALIAKIN